MTDEHVTTRPAIQQGLWPEPKSGRPVGLSLMLPIAELTAVNNESAVEGFWDIAAMAKLAVEIGYDMLWAPDHFILKLEHHGGESRGVWECWTTTAGIAATVPGAAIGTMVAATSFHNPGSIAKMAEAIDSISLGNFVLGLGCGWHEDEYTMFGLPFDHRVSRFEEAMQIISSLVRTGRANVEGEFYQARNAVNFPRGPRWQHGGPPILFGAQQPRMMRLTAMYADAWDGDWQNDPAVVVAKMAELDQACLDVGRESAGLLRTAGTQFEMGEHPYQFRPFRGTKDEMVATMHSFADLGLKNYRATPSPCTLDTLERFGEVIHAFDRG